MLQKNSSILKNVTYVLQKNNLILKNVTYMLQKIPRFFRIQVEKIILKPSLTYNKYPTKT